MKIAVIGLGSIGNRHAENLRRLRPLCELVGYDPGLGIGTHYPTLAEFLNAHLDADGVIVASPTDCHAEQIEAVLRRGLPAYIEKPLTLAAQWTPTQREALLRLGDGLKVAIGHQYRFSIERETVERALYDNSIVFHARDNLIERYGATVLETMGSHAIDLALKVLGPAHAVALFTDGCYFKGRVEHVRGVSEYDMRIDVGPRTSTLNGHDLTASNATYIEALGAWLDWIERGERDDRLATLADGVRVMDVMAKCKILATGATQ